MLITNDASIDLERLAIAGLGLVQFAKSTVTSQNLGKVLAFDIFHFNVGNIIVKVADRVLGSCLAQFFVALVQFCRDSGLCSTAILQGSEYNDSLRESVCPWPPSRMIWQILNP